jgi:hypothetical protein
MEETKKQEEYKLVDVPTEYGKAIQDSSGKYISELDLLVWIANEVKNMSKKLG